MKLGMGQLLRSVIVVQALVAASPTLAQGWRTTPLVLGDPSFGWTTRRWP
jgi:hypothetical protein